MIIYRRLLPWAELFNASGMLLLLCIAAWTGSAQTRDYPKEIRGYKVERAVVESTDNQTGSDPDTLIQLGKPQLARITPLGVTFEVPLVVAPVKRSGHVDFLLFEAIVINGTSVDIDEYRRAFDLPNKQPLTLRDPLSIYLHLPSAVLAAIYEWSNSKETWPVTGRVYVCGSFRKSILSFKRCVPVEINTTMRNPLQNRER